jgi:hypothetical protein
MLIMMYAYARASGNGTSIQTYVGSSRRCARLCDDLISLQYPLLQNWTDYLVNTTLYTSNQYCHLVPRMLLTR